MNQETLSLISATLTIIETSALWLPKVHSIWRFFNYWSAKVVVENIYFLERIITTPYKNTNTLLSFMMTIPAQQKLEKYHSNTHYFKTYNSFTFYGALNHNWIKLYFMKTCL